MFYALRTSIAVRISLPPVILLTSEKYCRVRLHSAKLFVCYLVSCSYLCPDVPHGPRLHNVQTATNDQEAQILIGPPVRSFREGKKRYCSLIVLSFIYSILLLYIHIYVIFPNPLLYPLLLTHKSEKLFKFSEIKFY